MPTSHSCHHCPSLLHRLPQCRHRDCIFRIILLLIMNLLSRLKHYVDSVVHAYNKCHTYQLVPHRIQPSSSEHYSYSSYIDYRLYGAYWGVISVSTSRQTSLTSLGPSHASLVYFDPQHVFRHHHKTIVLFLLICVRHTSAADTTYGCYSCASTEFELVISESVSFSSV